jgi:microcystin-dependent protein
MADPFLSEIRLMSFSFAPKGWAKCDGQLLPINQNQALFALMGTTYGGNGQTTFALPDMRGRVPIHTGGAGGHVLGERGGEQAHTLSAAEMPQHVHFLSGATNDATTDTPDPSLVLANAALDMYRSPTNLTSMEPGMVGNVGGSQAHTNMQPYLTISFCVALQGIFPSQN